MTLDAMLTPPERESAVTVTPLTLGEARDYVTAHHRHHPAPLGGLFAIGASRGEAVVGVVIVGRPVARMLADVWTIAAAPYHGAHFATFPQRLVEPCIKAGTSERGACAECGAPWVRELERVAMVLARSERTHPMGRTRTSGTMLEPPRSTTTGWSPTCDHGAEPVPATVLDPFGGSGTVALVAERLGRRAILIELSADYCGQALERIAGGRRDGSGAPADLPLPAPPDSLWEHSA